MAAVVDAEKCKASGECIDVCPTEAITLENNVAVVDEDVCSDCGVCADACPEDAITVE